MGRKKEFGQYYGRNDYVSIWIGKCENPEKLMEYLELDYEKINYYDEIGYEMGRDYGIISYDPDWILLKYLEKPTNDLNEILNKNLPDNVIKHFEILYKDRLKENYNCSIVICQMNYNGRIKKVNNEKYGKYVYLGAVKLKVADMF